MYCRDYVDFTEDERFALAIRSIGVDNHMGLLCFSDPESPNIIHLNGDSHVVLTALSENYFWVKFNDLHPLILDTLAANCLALYDTYKIGGIPFSAYARGKFKDGEYVGEEGEGMTCSSFVKEFLTDNAVELIDESSWQYREDDALWQRDAVAGIDGLFNRDDIDLPKVFRFRPEEVAAAAVLPDAPNTMDIIIPVSGKINQELNAKTT